MREQFFISRSHKVVVVAGFLMCAAFVRAVYAEDVVSLHAYAVQAAKEGDRDGAFMYYHCIPAASPKSTYAADALFAQGEYYYLTGAREESISSFTRFVREYPESKGRPFALVYLCVIARAMNNPSVTQELERHIVTLQQVSLLFRQQKQLNYISPLMRKHSISYYIDKVECYADGKLFAQISY